MLVGWFAFWLVGAFAPCCGDAISTAQAAGQGATIRLQASAHEPALGDPRDMPCSGALETSPAVTTQAAMPLDTPLRLPVHVALVTWLPGAATSEPAQPRVASPPPVPYHLRTARLLI